MKFFDRFITYAPDQKDLILRRLGINYDTCHLAVEYESAEESLKRLADNHIRVSKIHLSSALKVADFTDSTLQTLGSYCEETYLHQVIARSDDAPLQRYEDLDIALDARVSGEDKADEWRIHFHIPLHALPQEPLFSTSDHIRGTLDFLKANPETCRHFEMETYTWEVLPNELGKTDVVDQLVKEYEWTLAELDKRGLQN